MQLLTKQNVLIARCQKSFATIVYGGKGGNHAKLAFLLKVVNLNERLLIKTAAFEEILTVKINYRKVDEAFKRVRQVGRIFAVMYRDRGKKP